jgi:glycosyltransferase involved in cell wall biosynthesis
MPSPLTIVQADFHHHWGGQAEVVLALSQALATRGHKLVVVCPAQKVTAGRVEESDLSARAREAGLTVFTQCQFRKGLRPISILNDVKKLGAYLRELQPDIYHCHGSQDHWTGVFAIRRFGLAAQVVRTRHNIYPIQTHAFNRWLFRKKTAQVITIFDDQKKFFTEPGLLQAEDLVTIHSPLPQSFAESGPVERRVREELGLGDGTPLVGFVANFHPDKAPLDFVAAAAEILKTRPDARFAMAGHGPLDEPLRAALAAQNLTDRVHLLGFRKDMHQVMASFDLLLLTSVTREASSTVLKQAGAMGVPVIATDIGGTREIVEDGTTGLLTRPGDPASLAALALSLLNDGPRARAMGAAAKKKILGEFTAAALAVRTEEVYRQVLERKRAKA